MSLFVVGAAIVGAFVGGTVADSIGAGLPGFVLLTVFTALLFSQVVLVLRRISL